MFGWNHPGEAIGPEPGPTFPEARAEWHAKSVSMTIPLPSEMAYFGHPCDCPLDC